MRCFERTVEPFQWASRPQPAPLWSQSAIIFTWNHCVLDGLAPHGAAAVESFPSGFQVAIHARCRCDWTCAAYTSKTSAAGGSWVQNPPILRADDVRIPLKDPDSKPNRWYTWTAPAWKSHVASTWGPVVVYTYVQYVEMGRKTLRPVNIGGVLAESG